MTEHRVVSRDEWLQARRELLAEEKALTRQRDALSARRRELPWVRVDKQYVFDGPNGRETLAELFGPHHSLIVDHFMFGPDWPEGCPSCSFWADNFNGIDIHLAHRNIAFVAVSRARFATLDAYRQRMGWTFKWVSSFDSEFNYDYEVSFTPEQVAKGEMNYNFGVQRFPSSEGPGFSAFYKADDGTVYHTYSCFSRGVDILNGAYHLMDIAPKGRDEQGLPYSMAWLRRHDQYGQ
jgi:predicted dithiol-disulfide oxidoreductase (DUF899 family)